MAWLSFSETFGQTTFDAEFRPRSEYRQGFRKPLADTLSPALSTMQRTRLNADYKGKILNARLSLQDARLWGNSDNRINTSKLEIKYYKMKGVDIHPQQWVYQMFTIRPQFYKTPPIPESK